MRMYNWSVDEKILKKDKRGYAIWKLEQMVNFGLNNERIDERTLRRYLPEMNIDPFRRKFFELILNEKRNSQRKPARRSPKDIGR